MRAEAERLHRLINEPETEDFIAGVRREVAHQRERWGEEHDANKLPFDWAFAFGHLSGKATAAATFGDWAKARHHMISSAALLANWHRISKAGGR